MYNNSRLLNSGRIPACDQHLKRYLWYRNKGYIRFHSGAGFIFFLGPAMVMLLSIVVSLTCTAYLYWAFIETGIKKYK